MKYIRLCLRQAILFALPFCAYAQNLVPNPSFEDFNYCPNGISAIDYSPGYTSFPSVKSWVNPLKRTSPDYFHTCAAPNSGVHVPEITFGHQRPHTGNAFAGIIAWEEYATGGGFGEYLQCKLTAPLKAGEKYCVSFFVSPSISKDIARNYIAIDEVGINFGKTQAYNASNEFLSLPYDIVTPFSTYLTDSSAWIRVSGIYAAKGGEEWLTIGRFNNTGLPPNSVQAYPATPDPNMDFRAYIYVDDVNVSLITAADTIVSVQDSSYCDTTALPMTLASSGYDGNFIWNTGETTRKIVATTPGIYWCKSIADCKVYYDTIVVKYDPNLQLDLGKEIINCTNGPVMIKGGGRYHTYKWSTGETTSAITVTQPGTYWLMAENNCGKQQDTVKVYIQSPTDPPAVRDTMICQLVNDALLNVKGDNLQWYTHPMALIGSPIQPYVYTKEVGTYTLYVSQTWGKCESEKVPVNIDVKYQPRHTLEDRIDMCQQDLKYIGDEYPGVKYAWNTGENTCCILPKYEGLYRVAITNECGTYVDSTRVSYSLCDKCIFIPNAFSPNGDGINDKFVLSQTCAVSDFHLRIYDRWGKMVFDTKDIRRSWTGTIEGEYVNAGVYVYILEYRSAGTKLDKFLKGNITVLR